MAADEMDEEEFITDEPSSEETQKPQWEQPESPEAAQEIYRSIKFTYHDGSTYSWVNVTSTVREIISEARKNGGWYNGNDTAINLKYVRSMLVTAISDTEQEGFTPERKENLR